MLFSVKLDLKRTHARKIKHVFWWFTVREQLWFKKAVSEVHAAVWHFHVFPLLTCLCPIPSHYILPKHDKTNVISYGVCQEIIDKIIKERKYREGRTCLPRFQESLNFKSEIFVSICGHNALWSLGGICLHGFQGSPKSGWWWIVRLFR